MAKKSKTIFPETILEIVTHIAEVLSGTFASSTNHAWWILEAIAGKKREQLVAHNSAGLTPEQQIMLDSWLTALIRDKIPLQYLIGSVPFGDLEILVEQPTLIPRPETEEWCMNLIGQLQCLNNKKLTILDLCSGSGCIALSLAQALPRASVYGVDIANSALALAEKNKIHNKINNVTFIHSDLFKSLTPDITFDLIIANPPYIAESEWETLAPSVTQWEDKNALIADDNGFTLIKEILEKAPLYLSKNAELAMLKIPNIWIEIGYLQGARAKELMQEYNYRDIEVKKDLADKGRVLVGRI